MNVPPDICGDPGKGQLLPERLELVRQFIRHEKSSLENIPLTKGRRKGEAFRGLS